MSALSCSREQMLGQSFLLLLEMGPEEASNALQRGHSEEGAEDGLVSCSGSLWPCGQPALSQLCNPCSYPRLGAPIFPPQQWDQLSILSPGLLT